MVSNPPQNFLIVLKMFLDGQMLASALKALWSLCVNELNAGIATAEKAFKEIIKILEKYPKEEKIVEESMSAIWALCLEDDNEDLVIDAGIGLVIDALNAHPKNPKSKNSIRFCLRVLFISIQYYAQH